MDIFLQQIINGLTLGSIYALVALGYRPAEATRLIETAETAGAGADEGAAGPSTEDLIRRALQSAARAGGA